MQRAEVTDDVWSSLLALAAGRPARPRRQWSAPERAAFALYQPLAVGAGDAPSLFAQVGQSLDGRIATAVGRRRRRSPGRTACATCTAAARWPTRSSSGSAPRSPTTRG